MTDLIHVLDSAICSHYFGTSSGLLVIAVYICYGGRQPCGTYWLIIVAVA